MSDWRGPIQPKERAFYDSLHRRRLWAAAWQCSVLLCEVMRRMYLQALRETDLAYREHYHEEASPGA